jgi:hypothetical protein
MTSLAFMFDCVPEPVCHTNKEVIVELPLDDLFCRRDDEVGPVLRKPVELRVDQGRGLLQDPESPNHVYGHPVVPDREMMKGSLGLGTPVPVGGHVHGTHAIGLFPCFWPHLAPRILAWFPGATQLISA